jgi:hypothetical protein
MIKTIIPSQVCIFPPPLELPFPSKKQVQTRSDHGNSNHLQKYSDMAIPRMKAVRHQYHRE